MDTWDGFGLTLLQVSVTYRPTHELYVSPVIFQSVKSNGAFSWPKEWLRNTAGLTGTHELLGETINGTSTTSNRAVPAPTNPNVDGEEQCRQLC